MIYPLHKLEYQEIRMIELVKYEIEMLEISRLNLVFFVFFSFFSEIRNQVSNKCILEYFYIIFETIYVWKF